jgi:outer membrane protein OmpA-like peptidoglycan-associated protein
MARTGVHYPGPVEHCPCGNARCAAVIEPVSLWEVMHRRYGREMKLTVIASGVLLVFICIFLALRKNPLLEEVKRLQTQVAALDSRLRTEESIPTPPSINPLDSLRRLAARATELEEKIAAYVQAQKIDDARAALQALESLPKQAEIAVKTARNPSPISGERTATAKQLISEFQDANGVAQRLLEKVKGSPRFAADVEQASEQIEQGLVRARHLIPKRAAPVSEGELTKLLATVNGFLAKGRDEINRYVPPLAIPFAEQEATLTIAATSDLAQNLVLPILKAHSGGDAVEAPGEVWYYTSKTSFQPAEKVVVKVVAQAPLRELVAERADLILTDRDPTAEEAQLFKQKFPDQKLNSRSISEVIALDALTMLAHPDSKDVALNFEQAHATAWIGGQVGSVEYATAQRFNFQIAETADRPADAVLANPASRGLGLYHRDGKIRCKRLAYTPGGGAPALEPSPFTIAAKNYKFAFDIVASYSPRSRLGASQLLNFMISDDGQNIVARQGYVDRRLRGERKPVDPVVLAVLGRALGRNVTGAIQLPTDIRFPFDIDDLSPRAQADLEQLPALIARDYSKGSLVILGFTDDVGTADYNLKLSVKRALSVADRMKRAIPEVLHTGLGALLPVDNNATIEGRERNRRAEVWVIAD